MSMEELSVFWYRLQFLSYSCCDLTIKKCWGALDITSKGVINITQNWVIMPLCTMKYFSNPFSMVPQRKLPDNILGQRTRNDMKPCWHWGHPFHFLTCFSLKSKGSTGWQSEFQQSWIYSESLLLCFIHAEWIERIIFPLLQMQQAQPLNRQCDLSHSTSPYEQNVSFLSFLLVT